MFFAGLKPALKYSLRREYIFVPSRKTKSNHVDERARVHLCRAYSPRRWRRDHGTNKQIRTHGSSPLVGADGVYGLLLGGGNEILERASRFQRMEYVHTALAHYGLTFSKGHRRPSKCVAKTGHGLGLSRFRPSRACPCFTRKRLSDPLLLCGFV